MMRNCPLCSNNITYKTKSQYNDAVKKNRICKMCRNREVSKNRRYTGSLIKSCTKCGNSHTFSNNGKYKQAKNDLIYVCKSCAIKKEHTGKATSEKTRKMMSDAKIGKLWSPEARQALSKKMRGKNNPMYGKIRNDIRLQWLKTLEVSGIKPRPFYNPEACKKIDEYGKKNGYNFQHAENGGEFYIEELGYWVDGYDKEKNVVIEYDEPHHFRPRQIAKDLYRQKAIEEKMNCKFIRLCEMELV